MYLRQTHILPILKSQLVLQKLLFTVLLFVLLYFFYYIIVVNKT